MSEKLELQEWLTAGKYLPPILRDFHDQKDMFKTMHEMYDKGEDQDARMPNWVDGHCYTIDWFLWFMASRGYTLQKSRCKKVDFIDYHQSLEDAYEKRSDRSMAMLEQVFG